MKIKALLLAVIIFNSSFVIANADVVSLDWPPDYGSAQNYLGVTIQDDFSSGMVNRLSIPLMPGPQPFCSSLDDPLCAQHKSIGWWVLRVLPQCSDTVATDDCVEGLTVTQGGESREAVLLERIKEKTWTADPARGLPIAGSQGLWSDPFSTNQNRKYYVNVFGDLSAQDREKGPFKLSNFYSSIVATEENSNFAGSCSWHVNQRCGHRVQFGEETRLTLRLHLTPELTGWLGGRLDKPEIKVTSLNSSVNLLEVSASPVNVNMVGAVLPYSSAPAELRDFMRNANPGCPAEQCNVGIQSSGVQTFEYLDRWKGILKDTATKTIPYWSVSKGIAVLNTSCVKNGFVGLVTTNATVYQQDMPVLNGDEITYKVAGTHFMPDGTTISKGTYNLIIRSDVARCVYNFSQAPIRASVSIVTDGDVQSVATEVVNEKNGWMYLSANGFHFSQDSIKVKLSQDTAPNSKPGQTTQASPASPAKKVTITCAKGKVTKKVTAIKPVCPKGYKKVA